MELCHPFFLVGVCGKTRTVFRVNKLTPLQRAVCALQGRTFFSSRGNKFSFPWRRVSSGVETCGPLRGSVNLLTPGLFLSSLNKKVLFARPFREGVQNSGFRQYHFGNQYSPAFHAPLPPSKQENRINIPFPQHLTINFEHPTF